MFPTDSPVGSHSIEDLKSCQCNCDFPGISKYICKCCKPNLTDFLKKKGIVCSGIVPKGLFICIFYSCFHVCYQEHEVESLAMDYVCYLLRHIQYAIIPGVRPKQKDMVEEKVYALSKGWVPVIRSHI